MIIPAYLSLVSHWLKISITIEVNHYTYKYRTKVLEELRYLIPVMKNVHFSHLFYYDIFYNLTRVEDLLKSLLSR